MKFKKLLMAGLLMFTAVCARAVAPVTLETGYTYGVKSCVFNNVTSGTCDPGGFGSVGYSSSSANVVGFDWQVMVVGSTGSFTISYTTKTYSSNAANPAPYTNQEPLGLAGVAANVLTSPAITIPPGLTSPLRGEFQALTVNPYLTFSSLDLKATTYVLIEYGTQKHP